MKPLSPFVALYRNSHQVKQVIRCLSHDYLELTEEHEKDVTSFKDFTYLKL